MATKWVAQIAPPVATAPAESQASRALPEAATERWISAMTVYEPKMQISAASATNRRSCS